MTTGPIRTRGDDPRPREGRRAEAGDGAPAATGQAGEAKEPMVLSVAELGRRAVVEAGTRSAAVAFFPLRLLVAPFIEPVRLNVRRSIGRAVGAPQTARRDQAARRGRGRTGVTGRRVQLFLPPDAVARRVHGDFPSMMIGGLAALLLQVLHPLVMAGVADHSHYAVDPLGRLRRTASFVGLTTFGSVADAEAAISRVRSAHATVTGRSPDGRPYRADDPDLLTWVHAAEMSSFLAASRRYGVAHLAPGDADRYIEETAEVALRLGAEWVPRTEGELDAYMRYVRPQLYAGAQALAARDFLLRGVARRPEQQAVHACIAAAAVGLLPAWARRELRLPAPPLVDLVVVRPAAWTLCHGLRWAIGPDGPDRGGA